MKNALKKLTTPTKICKLCFKEYIDVSTYSLLHNDSYCCPNCYHQFNPIFSISKLSNIEVLSIYNYDEVMHNLIYQLKGCYDYELGPIFLSRYAHELKLKYWNYHMVPVPSYHLDDERRGFNHVKVIFAPLKLKMIDCLYKAKEYKQSDHTRGGRKEIHKVLKIKDANEIKGKNILIVDDIFTTGNTLLAAIHLIKQFQPKRIKILVLAKVVPKFKDDTK